MQQNTNVIRFLDHPTKGASIAFAILFLVSAVLHIQQSRRYKSWSYTWPLPFACIIEVAAFICLEVTAHHQYFDGDASAIQGLFYAAAPVFALPLYLHLPRLLATQPQHLRIRPIYIICVVNCFQTAIITCLSQGAATYWNLNASHDTIRSGLALIKASLILQLILNDAFLCIVGMYRHRMSKRYMPNEGLRDKRLSNLTKVLLGLVVLMVVRNVFRTVQIWANPLSGLWMDEVWFWVFEAGTMLAYTFMWHAYHPGKYVVVGNEWCRSTD